MAGTSTLQPAEKVIRKKSTTTKEQPMEQPKPIVQEAEQEIQHLSDKAIKDYKLVRKAVDDGDQKAYAELMSRYKDSIYYMLLKMVNNRDDAEDLTIEAFGRRSVIFVSILRIMHSVPGCLKLLQTTVSTLSVKSGS